MHLFNIYYHFGECDVRVWFNFSLLEDKKKSQKFVSSPIGCTISSKKSNKNSNLLNYWLKIKFNQNLIFLYVKKVCNAVPAPFRLWNTTKAKHKSRCV